MKENETNDTVCCLPVLTRLTALVGIISAPFCRILKGWAAQDLRIRNNRVTAPIARYHLQQKRG